MEFPLWNHTCMLFVFFLKLSPRFGFQHLLPNGFKPVLRKECNIYVCIQNKVAFSENYLVSPPHAKYSMSLHFLSFSDDNDITNFLPHLSHLFWKNAIGFLRFLISVSTKLHNLSICMPIQGGRCEYSPSSLYVVLCCHRPKSDKRNIQWQNVFLRSSFLLRRKCCGGQMTWRECENSDFPQDWEKYRAFHISCCSMTAGIYLPIEQTFS